jgi:hypothetical protein
MDPVGVFIALAAAAAATGIVGGTSVVMGATFWRHRKRRHPIPRTQMYAIDSPWSLEILGSFVVDMRRVWKKHDHRRRDKIDAALARGQITFIHDNRQYIDDAWGRKIRGTQPSRGHINVVVWDGASISDTALSWELARMALREMGDPIYDAPNLSHDDAIRATLAELASTWG